MASQPSDAARPAAAAHEAPDGKLAGRLALVTGASRGLGRAVALAFAREGAHVIALARTRGALAELDDEIRANGGAPTSLIALNLADGERVDALGPSLYSRFGGLDVFVGNAGSLGVLAPLAHTQTKDWQSVFDVNVGANWRLIRTLDPLLRRSAAGRAIFVTAGAAQERRAYWGPYAASKAALEALAMCYAREVASTSVRVNVVDPGRMRTGLRAAAYPGEPRENSPPPELLAPRFVDYACADCASHGEIIRLQDSSMRSPS